MRFIDLKSGEPAPAVRTVTALGYFDGVHIGHRELLRRTCKLADELSAVPAVWTFEHGNKDYGLCETEERLRLIADCGIKLAAVSDFSEIKDLSAEQFVKDVLEDLMHCAGAVCGYNFRFGKGASAGCADLSELLGKSGAVTVTVPEVRYGKLTVSSSAIRTALKAGEAELAAGMLGRAFSIRAEVVHGRGLGRTLGFPTVNQRFSPDALYPRFGVYCVKLFIDGAEYRGVANIGRSPTVAENGEVRAETFIFDFDDDIYGKQVRTELCRFLRDERKFDSREELAAAVAADIRNAENYFCPEQEQAL